MIERSYLRGDLLCFAGPAVTVVTTPDASDFMTVIEMTVQAANNLQGMIAPLLAWGISKLPEFAVVEERDSALHTLLRGRFQLDIAGPNSRNISGIGMHTWREFTGAGWAEATIAFDTALCGVTRADRWEAAQPFKLGAMHLEMLRYRQQIRADMQSVHGPVDEQRTPTGVHPLISPQSPVIRPKPPTVTPALPQVIQQEQPATVQQYSEPSPWGTLIFANGKEVPITEQVLIGRMPRSSEFDAEHAVRLVAVESPHRDVSRTHLKVSRHHSTVTVEDLGSRNGSFVTYPGTMPQRLQPNTPIPVTEGAYIDMGDGATFIVKGVKR